MLRTIQFSDEGKRLTASLTHGDKLAGEPLFAELKVSTSFGRVAFTTAQMRMLTLMAAPKAAVPAGANTPVR